MGVIRMQTQRGMLARLQVLQECPAGHSVPDTQRERRQTQRGKPKPRARPQATRLRASSGCKPSGECLQDCKFYRSAQRDTRCLRRQTQRGKPKLRARPKATRLRALYLMSVIRMQTQRKLLARLRVLQECPAGHLVPDTQRERWQTQRGKPKPRARPKRIRLLALLRVLGDPLA